MGFIKGTPSQDYISRVVRGEVEDAFCIDKFGANDQIDTAQAADIWTGGGSQVGNQIFTYEGFDLAIDGVSAEIMNIVSTDDEDGGAGTDTGALTMFMEGLDSVGDRIEEAIVLNGLTIVESSLTYTRVYRAFILTAGSTGTNLGKITMTAKTSGFRMAQIDNSTSEKNQTLQAMYTIPRNYNGLLIAIFASIARSNVATECDIEGYIRPFGGVFLLRLKRNMITFGTSHFDLDLSNGPTFIPELADVKARSGISSSNSIGMTAGFTILCQKIDPNIPG